MLSTMTVALLSQDTSNDDALLRRLRVFLAVVDQGGVSAAARALQISQPAVSTQIKRLEAELGTSLFRRNGRRLVPNEQGLEIARILRQGLNELSATLNSVRDVSRARPAPLRFGFSAPQIALEAADIFRKADPHTVLELKAANSSDLFRALDAYELDVIMIGLEQPRPPYHCQFFLRQFVTVMVPLDHPFAARDTVSLKDLAREPIVLRESGSYTRELLMKAFSDMGLTPRIAFEVATREAVTEAVIRGFGIGPVLNGEAPLTGKLVCVTLEAGALVADDYLICHASSLNYGPVKRFLAASLRSGP